jgi:hypothetical protein
MSLFFRSLSTILVSLVPVNPASAQDEAPPSTDSGKNIALSVGTGPRPLDTLTLGLTGLGGRLILVDEAKLDTVIGFSHTSGRVSSFPEDSFGDRFFTRVGTTTAFVGMRGGSKPLGDTEVMAYGIGGALLTRQVSGGGEPNDVFHSGGYGLGGVGGFGLDGFLAPGLSVGAELGGIAIYYMGGNRFDGTSEIEFSGFGLSSYASLQVTVWK